MASRLMSLVASVPFRSGTKARSECSAPQRGGRRLPARGTMDGFVATFVNRLDQKGRVSVPASYRAVLAREGQDGVYCYPALDRPAIDGGGSRLQEEIAKRL